MRKGEAAGPTVEGRLIPDRGNGAPRRRLRGALCWRGCLALEVGCRGSQVQEELLRDAVGAVEEGDRSLHQPLGLVVGPAPAPLVAAHPVDADLVVELQ